MLFAVLSHYIKFKLRNTKIPELTLINAPKAVIAIIFAASLSLPPISLTMIKLTVAVGADVIKNKTPRSIPLNPYK